MVGVFVILGWVKLGRKQSNEIILMVSAKLMGFLIRCYLGLIMFLSYWVNFVDIFMS